MSSGRSLPATVDPYDHAAPENQLPVHRADERKLAMRTALGALVLDSGSEFVALARASGIPAERLVLELTTVARMRPEILRCTRDSIMTFLLDVATTGLAIGSEVYPVPIKHNRGRPNEELRLEAWPSYQGLRTLAIATGAVRDIWAQVVYTGDDFVFARAPIPHVARHNEGEHFGDMTHARAVYASAVFPGGVVRSVLLSKERIDELRARNRGDTTKADSPWVTHPEQMWQAKATKVLAKTLPRNPRLAHLIRMEERLEGVAAPPARAAIGDGSSTDAREGPAGAASADEDLPPDEPEVEMPGAPMALGAAEALLVQLQGGRQRRLGELRNRGLESVRAWARKRLEEDPESRPLQRIAEGCTVLLEARADGRAKEPPSTRADAPAA